MRSCMVFGEKENIPKNSLCSGFVSKGFNRVFVLFA
jgi:hypothetical protein